MPRAVNPELIISIIGTVATLVALAFAWAQLRRTAKSVETANQVSSKLRTRIDLFDSATESLKASSSLQHCVKLLQNSMWDDAARALWEAQVSLNRIRYFDDPRSIRAKFTQDQVIEVVTELEDSFVKGVDYQAKDLIILLRKQINILENEFILRNQGLIDND